MIPGDKRIDKMKKKKGKREHKYVIYVLRTSLMQASKFGHRSKNSKATYLCLSYAGDPPFSLVQPLQPHEPDNKSKESQNLNPHVKSFGGCCMFILAMHIFSFT